MQRPHERVTERATEHATDCAVDRATSSATHSATHSATSSADEGGFTLVEMLVAMFILVVVSLALGTVFITSLTTVAQAEQRQAATGLATRAMEELRALPYATVTSGLNTSDLAGDANLAGSPAQLVLPTEGISEQLVTYTPPVAGAPTQPPLYPHASTSTVNGLTYTVRTYVTRNTTTPQPSVNLTVVVDWTGRGSDGAHRTVQRSTAYSPTSCLSTATHPFSGPCQASFAGQAGLTGGSISVTNDTDSSQDILGFAGARIALSLPGLSTSLAVEQIATASGSAQNSAAGVTADSGGTASGGGSAVVSADADPSSTDALTGAATTPAQTAAPVTLTGAAGTLTAAPTSADAGNLAAAMAAGAGSCVDEQGTGQAPNQPCVAGAQTRAGSAASLTVDLGASTGLAPFTLAQVGGDGAARAVVARFTAPGTVQCPGTTGVGCVSAGASRSLGSVSVGGLPTGADTGLPAGFTTLFTVSGVQERAYAELGLKRLTYARPPAITRTAGTLQYWTGAGYASLNLAGLASDTSLTVPEIDATYAGGAVVVQLTTTLTAGAAGSATASPLNPADPNCQAAACTADATAPSVVRAQTTYVVSVNGTPVTRFVVVTDLGALLAHASYQAAPNG